MSFLKPNIPRQPPLLPMPAPIVEEQDKETQIEDLPANFAGLQKKKASLGPKGLLFPPISNPL